MSMAAFTRRVVIIHRGATTTSIWTSPGLLNECRECYGFQDCDYPPGKVILLGPAPHNEVIWRGNDHSYSVEIRCNSKLLINDNNALTPELLVETRDLDLEIIEIGKQVDDLTADLDGMIMVFDNFEQKYV